ncbi:MAG: hypothetical protein ACR652_25110 [Methylocystis sp.]|uniref:hypothetical protein n=1 Tax=Methylocystis sp. TaxID=1911079 RepID=UPI003DA5599B
MTYTSDSRAIRHLTVDSADALANKSGKIGFAILMDESNPDSFDIVPLGNSKANVRELSAEELQAWQHAGPTTKRVEEGDDPTNYTGNARMPLDPYEQAAGANFERAAAQSHEVTKAAGETKTQKLTGDALRNKQMMDAARERSIRAEGIARNERIAAAMRAASDRQWKRSA